jgi:hypothetical protein
MTLALLSSISFDDSTHHETILSIDMLVFGGNLREGVEQTV